MLKAFLDMFESFSGNLRSVDKDYCGYSMVLKTFFFDNSCLLTVQHMHMILKHVEDPLVNKTNKVAKPIAISMLISLLHVGITSESFDAEFNKIESECQYRYDDKHQLNFWFSRLMVLVVPVLAYNIYSLQEYTKGTM